MDTLDMDTLVSVLVGIPAGVLASMVAWAILFLGIAPRITVSAVLSKVEKREAPGHFVYRFKFQNTGRRGILDLQIYARLYIRLLTYSVVQKAVDLRLDRAHIPRLRPRTAAQLITMLIDETQAFGRFPFPEHIQQKHRDESLLLEDILDLDPRARMRILIFGYDEFSGARRLLASDYYRKDNIVAAPFDRKSLRVLPLELVQKTDDLPKTLRTEGNSAATGVPPDSPPLDS